MQAAALSASVSVGSHSSGFERWACPEPAYSSCRRCLPPPAAACLPRRLAPPACTLQATAAASGKLLGAVVFERLPVIIPEEPEWEREYREWQQVSWLVAGAQGLALPS